MAQRIVHSVEDVLCRLKKEKFLLVHSESYDRLAIKTVFDGLPHIEFTDFTPNPLYEQVCDGIKVFNENHCTMLVAVGGGSTIDVAKCIKLFCRMGGSVNYLEQEKKDTGIPLIAVPTTAGTGSESTGHAVIYYEGKKQSVSHPSIIPDIAVLDPSTLKKLPLYQKKCTMLDALCQGIESWWSVNSTEESIGYSQKAVSMIARNWRDYIVGNTDEAAARIMEAANYAGKAINITATTAPHAMSYKLTGLYRFPHGHAVAVCMSEVWGYMLEHSEDCADSRGTDYFRRTLSDISELMSLERFRELLSELEMEYPHSENKEADIALLTESVNPVRLKNNPVALSSDVLRGMYERIVRP